MGITRARKFANISFSMNRFYQGDYIDSLASRFIEEIPEKFVEKKEYYNDYSNSDDGFEFNQDTDFENEKRSPGWMRYQKRLK